MLDEDYDPTIKKLYKPSIRKFRSDMFAKLKHKIK